MLAFITIDTTGYGPGVYPLVISGEPGVGFPATSFVGIGTAVANLVDGSIFTPEPSTLALAALGFAALAAWGWRRRKGRSGSYHGAR